MKIGVLGTGMVGRAIAGRSAELGHDVRVGTRDVAATLARTESDGYAAWARDHGAVTLTTFADAAAHADLVVNASGGGVSLEVLAQAGAANLDGKVLLDVANPLDFSAGFPPTLSVKDTDSLGEQIQRSFPGARVVKSLNTLTADLMVRPADLAEADHTIFVAGDDAAAKAVVTGLLTEFGHRDVIDLGDLAGARGTEMLLPVWLRLMGVLGTGQFNFKIVR
ncbi:NADPH-dependent F420 reductase [Actinokineospora sp.]|uniref:NADPH-dependent F420 reductase n=1 Tax=Actinokineospora sp. TaxID=1872133 RepID=UPI00403831A4